MWASGTKSELDGARESLLITEERETEMTQTYGDLPAQRPSDKLRLGGCRFNP